MIRMINIEPTLLWTVDYLLQLKLWLVVHPFLVLIIIKQEFSLLLIILKTKTYRRAIMFY